VRSPIDLMARSETVGQPSLEVTYVPFKEPEISQSNIARIAFILLDDALFSPVELLWSINCIVLLGKLKANTLLLLQLTSKLYVPVSKPAHFSSLR